MASDAIDSHLREAWEKARRLSDLRKHALIDFIAYLSHLEEEHEALDLCEEDIKAVEALLAGQDTADIPWDQVKREGREAQNRVLD